MILQVNLSEFFISWDKNYISQHAKICEISKLNERGKLIRRRKVLSLDFKRKNESYIESRKKIYFGGRRRRGILDYEKGRKCFILRIRKVKKNEIKYGNFIQLQLVLITLNISKWIKKKYYTQSLENKAKIK